MTIIALLAALTAAYWADRALRAERHARDAAAVADKSTGLFWDAAAERDRLRAQVEGRR